MTNFKVGDMVRLRSIGPSMTVIDLYTSSLRNSVECGWFTKDGTYRTGWFIAESLLKLKT